MVWRGPTHGRLHLTPSDIPAQPPPFYHAGAQGEGSTGAAIDAARPLWLLINMSGSLRRAMAYAGVRLRITAAVAHALHAIGGDARWLAPRARAHARRPRPHRAPVNRTALRRWCVDLVPLLLVGWRRSWRRGDGSSRCHSTRAQLSTLDQPDARRKRRRKAARVRARASAARRQGRLRRHSSSISGRLISCQRRFPLPLGGGARGERAALARRRPPRMHVQHAAPPCLLFLECCAALPPTDATCRCNELQSKGPVWTICGAVVASFCDSVRFEAPFPLLVIAEVLIGVSVDADREAAFEY